MVGVNFSLDNLKENWKHILVGVGVNCSFWYLIIFIFNRSLIIDLSFYVPMLITIPLAIISYNIGIVTGAFTYFLTDFKGILNKEIQSQTIDKGKKLEDGFENLPAKKGIGSSVMFFCSALVIAYFKYDFNLSLTKFTISFFVIITGLAILSLIGLIIVVVVMKSKTEKAVKAYDELMKLADGTE